MTDNKQPEVSELVWWIRDAANSICGQAGAKAHQEKLLEAATMIDALSSQQPAPKDEPQRQGGESDLTNGSGAWEYTRERTNYGGLGITLRDFGLHGWEAWHMYDASGDCLFVLFKRRIASRPATVVDDAAIDAVFKSLTDQCIRMNDPISHKQMRAALLAAFPEAKI